MSDAPMRISYEVSENEEIVAGIRNVLKMGAEDWARFTGRTENQLENPPIK